VILCFFNARRGSSLFLLRQDPPLLAPAQKDNPTLHGRPMIMFSFPPFFTSHPFISQVRPSLLRSRMELDPGDVLRPTPLPPPFGRRASSETPLLTARSPSSVRSFSFRYIGAAAVCIFPWRTEHLFFVPHESFIELRTGTYPSLSLLPLG